jgi:hypothetical protein
VSEGVSGWRSEGGREWVRIYPYCIYIMWCLKSEWEWVSEWVSEWVAGSRVESNRRPRGRCELQNHCATHSLTHGARPWLHTIVAAAL